MEFCFAVYYNENDMAYKLAIGHTGGEIEVIASPQVAQWFPSI